MIEMSTEHSVIQGSGLRWGYSVQRLRETRPRHRGGISEVIDANWIKEPFEDERHKDSDGELLLSGGSG